MSGWTTRVVEDKEYGYRILCKRLGMESSAGPRLNRGVPGSGTMCPVLTDGLWCGTDRDTIEKASSDLEQYLNDYEAKQRPKKRRRK